MSWIKKRGQPNTPNQSAISSVPIYNPNQHSNVQNQWQQQNFQPPSSNNWYTQNANDPNSYPQHSYNNSQQPQQYWTPLNQTQQPQHQEQQQPQQSYNHYQYQNPAGQQQYHYENYAPTQSQNLPQQQQEHYQNQVPQQNPETDSWNSWSWGEESNSNVQSGYVQGIPNQNPEPTVNIAENFINDKTWNWSLEESLSSTSSLQNQEPDKNVQSNEHSRDELFPKVGQTAAKHNQNSIKFVSPDFENQNSQVIGGNTAKSTINKIIKPETLPAQWSTESQISQDSSENIQTSESNSRILSRSSTTSESSLPLQDMGNVNNEKVNLLENKKISDTTLKNEPIRRNRPEEIEQHENIEIVSKPYPQSSKTAPTPPPPLKNQTPPLMPPPSSLDDSKNPYKRTTGLSHRSINKYKMDTQPQQNVPFPQQNTFQQSVNLETLPDNSEQPDTYPLQSTQLVRKASVTKQPLPHCPDNNEIAPINDRDQYLETGQLSNSEVMVENVDVLPPAGLKRMVLGQMGYNEQNAGDNQFEEPPPGLSRMVLGQNVNSEISKSKIPIGDNEIEEPPVGFPRMVPGESSSPENSKWNKGPTKRSGSRRDNSFPEPERDVYLSDNTQNQPSQTRSATIGADTPPVPPNPTLDPLNVDIAVPETKSNNDLELSSVKSRNENVSSSRAVKVPKSSSENIRRASIEGQPEDTEIVAITSSVRDLTVGGNLAESGASKGSSERPQRKSSVHETSDSDSKRDETLQKGRDHREREGKSRRYKDEGEYERDKDKSKRYSPSPDRYRDKKYDRRKYRERRYEEDTDYYSDKEQRDKRREQSDKYDDYRKYNSLRKDKYKEKQRRDPREAGRGSRDSKRADYYYGRYEEDYEDTPRSRPSSRTDSVQDAYRERAHGRDRHRERDRHRRQRDHRGDPYMQGYQYDPYNPYYQQLQYQYYENLRRTNPQAYAELYRKYYQQTGSQQAYGEEERASVHSGRSSANDELAKDRYTRQSFYSQASYPHVGDYYREAHSISSHYGHNDTRPYDRTDSSLNLEDTTNVSQRLTPAKFTTAHVKVSISSGLFVKILPHYPLDGQPAAVEIGGFQDCLLYDDEYRELAHFPGPLVKGVTHKKTIIEYCESKIRNAITNDDVGDTDSYILMWELMILLLRQNGMVVGTDIAELLMKDRKPETSRRPSIASNASSLALERTESLNNLNSEGSSVQPLKEEIITNKFREYLLYGSGKEALEWAMKHGLWGHALFLASKLDKRTYANVMTRFANGLPMNDPLQTLYQLLSGRIPAAVTCVADEKWGDWRPHLAMILSNTTQRLDLDRKAITTLADTLFSRGNLYAAHFCYLMAQVGFGRYGNESAKIVLLGANQARPFSQFATNEAIHLTEIYEYACSLNDSLFVLPEFQAYKYLIATRLSDRGLLEKSLAYLERVSNTILKNPNEYQPSLVVKVCQLADRLKYCEPVVVDDPDVDNVDYSTTRADNSWLKELRILEESYKVGHLTNQTIGYQTDQQTNQFGESQDIYQYQQQQQQQSFQQPTQQQYQYGTVGHESWQQQAQIPEQQSLLNQGVQDPQDGHASQQYVDQQQYWQNQQQTQQWPDPAVGQQVPTGLNQFDQQHQQNEQQEQLQNNVWNSAQPEPKEEVKKNDRDKDVGRPQISMPNQSRGNSAIFGDDEGNKTTLADKTAPDRPKSTRSGQDKPATTGWFGGIWNKLSLKPKNQMKLPDDKNPTIVWDEKKKRWVNLDEDGDGGSNEIKPPPKITDLMHNKPPASTPTPPSSYNPSSLDYQNSNQNNVGWNSAPNVVNYKNNNYNQENQNLRPSPLEDNVTTKPPLQPNMFKLQRSRNIKKSYVDVFNPGGKTSTSPAPSGSAPDVFNANANSYNNNAPQMNFFIPAPVNDSNAPVDFLTPAPMPRLQPLQNEASE